MSKIKILYLCDKKYWDHKMSRVRFHSIDAIAGHSEVNLIKSGPGWDDFIDAKQIVDKYSPDIIVWYKPLDIPKFDKIENIPRCLRYNEMWNIKWTTEEIEKSGSNLIICHHNNDIIKYQHIKTAKFFNNPHCANRQIFRDYGLMKEYDVLLMGSLSAVHYPLRARFLKIIRENIPTNFNCKILRHPGWTINNVDEQVIQYAMELNKARIVLACSSKYKYALSKYVEVPLCNSLLCGDIPDENQEWYKSWMLEVNNDMSDEEITQKITDYLIDDRKRNILVQKVFLENRNLRTQECYANRFVEIVNNFLGLGK